MTFFRSSHFLLETSMVAASMYHARCCVDSVSTTFSWPGLRSSRLASLSSICLCPATQLRLHTAGVLEILAVQERGHRETKWALVLGEQPILLLLN